MDAKIKYTKKNIMLVKEESEKLGLFPFLCESDSSHSLFPKEDKDGNIVLQCKECSIIEKLPEEVIKSVILTESLSKIDKIKNPDKFETSWYNKFNKVNNKKSFINLFEGYSIKAILSFLYYFFKGNQTRLDELQHKVDILKKEIDTLNNKPDTVKNITIKNKSPKKKDPFVFSPTNTQDLDDGYVD